MAHGGHAPRCTSLAVLGAVLGAALLPACSAGSPEGAPGEAENAFSFPDALEGALLFDQALPGTNGRACATCHVGAQHFTLSPADVAARLAANPSDPLFNPIDADNPTASTPTYQHLAAGLVRVTLPLADDLNVVDATGNVVTGPSRTITVWRGVPSVENVAYTSPYQFDGRFPTLQIQAGAALLAHSQMNPPPAQGTLDDLAAFEQTVFSDPGAARIARAIARGLPPPDPEPVFPPGSLEAEGQALFHAACVPCHGTPTQTKIADQAIVDQLHPVLDADGSMPVIVGQGGQVLPASVHHDLQGHPTANIGIAFGTWLTQIGALPSQTGVSFPCYRIRFYTDATRTQKLVDLPPLPPAIGPTGSPQACSVDPGLSATSGDVLDWEAFDIPQLRDIRHTGPYFHDNFARDLPAVIDTYSRFILGIVPQSASRATSLPRARTCLPRRSRRPRRPRSSPTSRRSEPEGLNLQLSCGRTW